MSQANRTKKAKKPAKLPIVRLVPGRPPQQLRTTRVSMSQHGGQKLTLAQLKQRVHLSPCARDYAACLVNPYNGPLACIPDFPAISSRRVRVYNKGTFSTSNAGTAAGFGFITFCPENAASSDGICVFSSDSTFTLPNISTTSATTGVVTGSCNADYTAAQIGATSALAQYRVVSAGLRIRYSGTRLNEGGQVYGFQDPTHESLDGKTISTMMANEQARKFPVSDRQWTQILYKQFTNSLFLKTAPNITTTQAAAAAPNVNYMGFIVQSPSPTTITTIHDYEAYAVLEYSGPNVRGIQNSHVDMSGYSAAHTVMQNGDHALPNQRPQETITANFFTEIGHYLLNGLTWVGEHAGEIASIAGAVVSLL